MITRAISNPKSVVALLLLLIPATYAVAQEPNQPIAITISTQNATVNSGTMIRLDIFTTNSSDQLVVIPSSRSGAEEAGINVRDAKGVPVMPSRKRGGFGSHPGAFIPPGKRIEESVPLSKWFDLTTPGKYSVEVEKRVHGFKGVAKSNTLTITVVAAK